MSDWHKNYINPTPKEFLAELKKRPDLSDELEIEDLTRDPEDNYIIYHGDLISEGAIEFGVTNVIVMGKVKAKVLSLSNEKSGLDEGGSFFAYGDVECDYFENHYGKMTVIAGSLTVHKILNADYDDSVLFIHKDVTAEYFHCPMVWINAKGKAKFTYGEGSCLPLVDEIYDDHDNATTPDNSIADSHEFLKNNYGLEVGNNIEDAVNDFMFSVIEEKIKNT